MERIANGMRMYRKPKLAEITEKKANSVKRKVKPSKTAKEVEIENTLFHYGCICKGCKEFDKFKESKRKGAVASPALAQVTPDKGNLLDDAKPQAKKKVSSKGKEEKTKETKPSNIYSVLKLDDPGNSCQVSGPRKCASSIKGKGLKGGAKTKAIEMQPIFEMAVKEAEKHGIKVTQSQTFLMLLQGTVCLRVFWTMLTTVKTISLRNLRMGLTVTENSL